MKVGFAGSGNMAAAMARGWAAAGGPEEMLFTDSGSGRAATLAEETGGRALPALGDLPTHSDLIVLAVKPKALPVAGEALAGFSGPVVSVLGATPLTALRGALPDAEVLRVMLNVGVEVGRGVVCHAPPEDAEAALPALELLGRIATLVELPEQQLDAATAVMGCSIAWIALACDAIAKAGAEAGLDPALSAELIARSAAVTGELLLRHDAETLQRAVASPGGSTEAGLDALAGRDTAGAFAYAVTASLERMEGKR
jgi:pyrroline-5-carboxylate reductase